MKIVRRFPTFRLRIVRLAQELPVGNAKMRVTSLPADEGFTFPCSRKSIDTIFGKRGLDWISFGLIGRHFKFDSHTEKRPELTGTVIASLTFRPDGSASLCLYPIAKAVYEATGKTNFVEEVLPHLGQWLETKRSQAAVAGSSHKQIIVEWTGTEHRFHELKRMHETN